METRKRSLKHDSNENIKQSKPKRQKLKKSTETASVGKPEKCAVCKQYIQDVKFYSGHLNKSCEEFVALTDDRLSLFTGDEECIPEGDELPSHKITHFSVYDEKGHLCSFDSGLVEKNVLLHVSGYIKPIYAEDSSPNDGIAAHDMGPINEWYISGFDGGEKAILGIVTAYAQYILMEPSEEYATFVNLLMRKIMLVKVIMEFLLNHHMEDPTYEDLLTRIENSGKPDLTEDFLLQHAQFVCDQIYSYDQAGEENLLLIVTPCVRTLVSLAGVTFRKRKKMRQTQEMTTKSTTFTKATTTPLVRSVFENFFPDQIEVKDQKGLKKRKCGVCDACQSPDCGQCSHCKDMVKFGGSGRSKQACKQRRCPNMAVEEVELSEDEEIEEMKQIVKKKSSSRRSVNKVVWIGQPVLGKKGRKFYTSCIVGENEIHTDDYVMLNPESANEPLSIGKVEYMYDRAPQGPTVHVILFYRGSNTILGETANQQELFAVNICEDCPLGCVIRKAEVIHEKTPTDWYNLGGTEPLHLYEDDDHTFYISKHYNLTTAAFTDYADLNHKKETNSCNNCVLEKEKHKFETPVIEDSNVLWRGETYRIGSAVFLNSTVYSFSSYMHETNSDSVKSVDESIYTEYYRKTNDIKGSNHDTPEPFCIGLIEDIWDQSSREITIKARIFYRPENTKSSVFLAHPSDVNAVYWTEEMVTVPFKKVVGKCYLMFFDIGDSQKNWFEEGPYRFYFTEAYDPKTYKFQEVPSIAKKIGYAGKGKGKGKGKSSKAPYEQPPTWEKIQQPLRCMDVFAGCGGLSNGLHQAGIAETKWAIEKETAAAQAFKLNNQNCQVFTDDCNNILQKAMSGDDGIKGLPTKGEVEMLVGGPPCQGFSGMNRFNAGQYSLFKNSLVVSFLSFCDYYRPKIFVLENVRNFVSIKKSMVLKLTLRCALDIGYQVTFGILQAGHYGVPQTRRRLILIGTAPGISLPKLPEPLHVFSKRGCHLSFAVDGVRYTNGNTWNESAPYRTICVRDAISDLPDIKNGCNKSEMPYNETPVSHFQRKMRSIQSDNVLIDHICKEMAPIVEARITQIPEIPGSDWRDLPNISVPLNNGTMTNVLKYPYLTKKQKKGEPNRGVCQCAVGMGCEPSDRQVNTLIPWCLPHTADRHNHWAGLYGRLEWDGYFGTTITNPEPMGKQGRVLHPEQNRVVSVRECARSQGFPDHFKFYGNIMDKHRQVGNAVPPPLGKAIGLEIQRVLAKVNFNDE